MPCHHLVKHRAETPQVGPWIYVYSLSLLRRHVIRCSDYRPCSSMDHRLSRRVGVGSRFLRLAQFRKAEIKQLNVAIAPDHYVFRFDVPMNDACSVRSYQRARRLTTYLEDLK